ncbi:hypothetical protein, partial [Mesorhizobium sp.]|uniref:hypothetical protein n=1 Tax=Mesorhizobium sp. TaxID=1871066 RepID=UPI0025C22B7F
RHSRFTSSAKRRTSLIGRLMALRKKASDFRATSISDFRSRRLSSSDAKAAARRLFGRYAGRVPVLFVKPIFTMLRHRCRPAAMFEYRGGATCAQATNPRLTARVFLWQQEYRYRKSAR